MNFEFIFPLLALLSFHIISILVFIVYVFFSIKKKIKCSYYDLTLYIFSFLMWCCGFFISDKYGIGFGKTLGNVSEILFVGIVMLIYMLVKCTYLIFNNRNLTRGMLYYMAGAVVLLSFFIGVLYPGIPE